MFTCLCDICVRYRFFCWLCVLDAGLHGPKQSRSPFNWFNPPLPLFVFPINKPASKCESTHPKLPFDWTAKSFDSSWSLFESEKLISLSLGSYFGVLVVKSNGMTPLFVVIGNGDDCWFVAASIDAVASISWAKSLTLSLLLLSINWSLSIALNVVCAFVAGKSVKCGLTSGIWSMLIGCLSGCLVCKCDSSADFILNMAPQCGHFLFIICRFCRNWPLRSRAREFWYQTWLGCSVVFFCLFYFWFLSKKDFWIFF